MIYDWMDGVRDRRSLHNNSDDDMMASENLLNVSRDTNVTSVGFSDG